MCKENCCCFTWNKWVTFVGLFFCVIQLIVSSIFNFHPFGFAMSIFGAICSIIYLCLILKKVREKRA